MKQKDLCIYAGLAFGAMVALIAIHRYFGRKKIQALKSREMANTEQVK